MTCEFTTLDFLGRKARVVLQLGCKFGHGLSPTHCGTNVMPNVVDRDRAQKRRHPRFPAVPLQRTRQLNKHIVHQVFRCLRITKQPPTKTTQCLVMRDVQRRNRLLVVGPRLRNRITFIRNPGKAPAKYFGESVQPLPTDLPTKLNTHRQWRAHNWAIGSRKLNPLRPHVPADTQQQAVVLRQSKADRRL